ncbi:MAG: DedA family protein, partial [Nitrospirae bacterium]
AWNALVGEYGVWAKPIFVGVGALVIMVGVPRMAVSVAGGMLFGIAMGLVTVLAATLLAAMVTFYLGRWLGRHVVERRFGDAHRIVRRVMREHGIAAVILIRQMPLTALMVNLLCSVSGVRARHYFIGSLIGLLPGSLIFVIFGAGVRRNFLLRAGGASLLLVLVTVGTLLVVNRTAWLQPLRELARRRKG